MAVYDPNDDAFDPSTYGSLQQSYLPKTRKQSAGGSLSQKSADAAFQRYIELSGGKDDYTQAQEQALTRSAQANMDDRLAIAAQYAGPKFAGMQESYLKRAMAGREPTRVGSAMIGPDGTVVRDPAAERARQEEMQYRLGQHYSQTAEREERRADRDYQIGVNEDERAYQRWRNDKNDASRARGSIAHVQDPITGDVTFYNTITGANVDSPLGTKPPTKGGPDLQSGFNFPNGTPKLNDMQDKARYFAQMMTAALPDMIEPLQNGYTPTRLDQVAVGPEASGYVGKMANALTTRGSASPLGRQFYTAGRQILAAILRKESGAAITDDEWTNYGPMYLPWPGESKEDTNRKMKMISTMIDNVAMGSGPAYRSFTAPKGYDDDSIIDLPTPPERP